MEMNVKELEKIVREVTSNDEHILIRNMLYGSEIDSKKLANAVKRYAYHAMDETVVGLSDHTLFGSAKEGFVITDKCLYSSFFKFSPSRKQVVTSHGHCIFFDGIKSVSPQKDSYLTINYADGNSITISCNNYREWIMNLLNGIIQPGAADEEESIAEPSIKEATAQKEKEEAERKAKEEAARKAKEEAARKAKEEAARKAKEEAARKAKEEAARKAKEEAQRKAKEEADRKLFEDIKRLNNIDAWEKADFMVFDDEADGVFKSAEALVKRNITEAKNAMGICYFHGIGTDPDKKIAMKWFEEAADLGNADGQYNIGLIYQYTLDVTYTNKSISWFEKAAEQGHLKAQKKLIKMYEYTGRAFTNLERADYWKKRMAAEHKDQHEESDWKLRVAANVYRENKDWDKNKPVLEFKDSDPFLMLVTDTVGLSRGTALGGTVIRGTVAVGDIIECPGQDENPLTLRVDGITMFNKRMPMAYTGMEISMLVNPVNTTQNPRSIIVRGSLLAWPGSLKTCTSFKAHIKRNDKLLLSCGKSTKPNTRYLTPGYPMSLEIFGMGSRMVFLKEIIGKDSIAFGEDAEVVIEAFSSEAPLPIERGFDFVLRERKRDLSGVDISIIGEGYCL